MRALLLGRGRRQLYLCREGSAWVGLLLRLHVQIFKKGMGPYVSVYIRTWATRVLSKENELAYWLVGESTLVSEGKENDLPTHVFY